MLVFFAYAMASRWWTSRGDSFFAQSHMHVWNSEVAATDWLAVGQWWTTQLECHTLRRSRLCYFILKELSIMRTRYLTSSRMLPFPLARSRVRSNHAVSVISMHQSYRSFFFHLNGSKWLPRYIRCSCTSFFGVFSDEGRVLSFSLL